MSLNIFEKITNRVRDGITILSSYPDCHTAAEHDMIYCGPADENLVTEKDRELLENLGWYKEDGSGWYTNV